MCRQLLRWRLPLPTYHGANGGWKSRGIEGGCTSAGAVTAEVPPLRLWLLLLLLLRRGVRCAMCRCRCRCHRRRPNASNGAAPAMFPTPMPKCESALCEIYTVLRIPPPRLRPLRSERCREGRALPAWPHPRRARPPAALCAPATADPGLSPNAKRSERGEGLRGRPHLGPGRGQSACTVPTWGCPRLQKPQPHPTCETPPSHLLLLLWGSRSGSGSRGTSRGWGRPQGAGDRRIDRTPSASKERGPGQQLQVTF
ncbi:uncharacterized protein LOC105290126 [Pteropus vampyrus]|uniref:Uncharacterized protein LOC105290126 n=1 Tax=Pteropus vampyrus TaxID=132908 RepID=A0A6P6CB49_PTEVA|nr:uncharacterized protein LOC105290126 [Pteropus vampyrus]